MEKFRQYTYGRLMLVQSDHKPLASILKKPLYVAPRRWQRMLLRLQGYEINLVYRSGKSMELSDTLSRAYLQTEIPTPFEKEVELVSSMECLSLAAARLDDIRVSTEADEGMKELKNVILKGWPEKRSDVSRNVSQYFGVRDELTVQDELVYRGQRVVVPQSLRKRMVQRIHASHIGVEGCLRRARESLYWPGMSRDIKEEVLKCDFCRTYDNNQPKETLQSHEVLDRPWAKDGVDLFTLNDRNYLIMVDYFSGFWEVDPLENTKAKAVIRKMKTQFARYGIPDVCMSDNGPQFTSDEFKNFSRTWKFKSITSSPRYPKSNGRVENAVQAAKRLMKKAKKDNFDVYLAILDYCNTPTQGTDSTPAQRLMSRRTKALLPTTRKLLEPKLVKHHHQKVKRNQQRQAKYYNRGAKDLPCLKQGDTVRVKDYGQNKWKDVSAKAKVLAECGIRSYRVQAEDGRILRRNRSQLTKTYENEQKNSVMPFEPEAVGTQVSSNENEKKIDSKPQPVDSNADNKEERNINLDQNIRTRSGRLVTKPIYLQDYISFVC